MFFICVGVRIRRIRPQTLGLLPGHLAYDNGLAYKHSFFRSHLVIRERMSGDCAEKNGK